MELNERELDRHITGNWGEDSVRPEPPDFAETDLALIAESLLRTAAALVEISPRAAAGHYNLAGAITRYLDAMGW